MSFAVYVLELHGGFWYVGKYPQEKLQDRIERHRCGDGAAWTVSLFALVEHLLLTYS